jgi:hypothetical protein
MTKRKVPAKSLQSSSPTFRCGPVPNDLDPVDSDWLLPLSGMQGRRAEWPFKAFTLGLCSRVPLEGGDEHARCLAYCHRKVAKGCFSHLAKIAV